MQQQKTRYPDTNVPNHRKCYCEHFAHMQRKLRRLEIEEEGLWFNYRGYICKNEIQRELPNSTQKSAPKRAETPSTKEAFPQGPAYAQSH
jgi:hypothetical protein